MAVSLFKAASTDQTIGTYLCDDNHGHWFIIVDGRDVRRTQLRELTDTGYSARVITRDVRNFEPLTPQDIEMWLTEQDDARDDDDRYYRYSGD